MKAMRRLKRGLWLAVLALAWPALGAAQVVVVGSKSPVGSLGAEQVAQLFLAKSSALPGGGNAVLIDLPEGQATRDAFYQKATGKNAAQMKALWSRLSFSGSAQPPRVLGSAAEVRRQLAADPNAIGYLDRADVDGSVKVVFAAE